MTIFTMFRRARAVPIISEHASPNFNLHAPAAAEPSACEHAAKLDGAVDTFLRALKSNEHCYVRPSATPQLYGLCYAFRSAVNAIRTKDQPPHDTPPAVGIPDATHSAVPPIASTSEALTELHDAVEQFMRFIQIGSLPVGGEPHVAFIRLTLARHVAKDALKSFAG